MAKTTSILWLAITLIGGATRAEAQTTKNIFVDVNLGVQTGSRTFAIDTTQIVYGETAFTTATHEFGSGAVFDIGGGYRVWRDLSIGLGFTSARTSADAIVTSAVPNPLFHDRRVVVTKTAPDLKHNETAFHLQAVWTVPVTDKVDASFVFGPSFLSVKQELVTGVTVPAGTQDAVPVIGEESDRSTGVNIGADLSYLVTPRYGFGGFIRYVGATVNLPGVPDLKAGGFQVGGGARLRF